MHFLSLLLTLFAATAQSADWEWAERHYRSAHVGCRTQIDGRDLIFTYSKINTGEAMTRPSDVLRLIDVEERNHLLRVQGELQLRSVTGTFEFVPSEHEGEEARATMVSVNYGADDGTATVRLSYGGQAYDFYGCRTGFKLGAVVAGARAVAASDSFLYGDGLLRLLPVVTSEDDIRGFNRIVGRATAQAPLFRDPVRAALQIYLYFVWIHTAEAGEWFLSALVRSGLPDEELSGVFVRLGITKATAERLLRWQDASRDQEVVTRYLN